ncbi:OprO/OprP family phosphate-selective porin [Pseudomaricurvus sp.]|uniref:OprO/OprP family phosphate-selective porin n=1 Tax=Pseudomaricurvus sp. TaxID=2004510 RepID=UPI003F6B8EFB
MSSVVAQTTLIKKSDNRVSVVNDSSTSEENNIKDETEETDPTDVLTLDNDVNTETTDPEINQVRLLQGLKDTTFKPVRSLLVDKKIPLLGIRWGADLQGDAPLNNEPEDASAILRLARMTFYRSFGKEWSAKVQGSWNSEGQFDVGDTYFVYTGWKTMQATFGIQQPAYSLENMTGRMALTFMERALPVEALSTRRSAGVSIHKRTTDSILSAGLYLFSPDDEGQQEKGQSIVLRYMHAPLDLDSDVTTGRFNLRRVWAGVSVSYRTNADEDNTRFRSLPEVGITEEHFVDTGDITGAEDIVRVGVEANRVMGPFSWQAEVLASRVERDHEDNVFFYGSYFFASWLLTGETRNYNSAAGEFASVNPSEAVGEGGWGAWELAVRASTVDLNDQDVVGGRQRNLSVGMNWYLNKQVRIQANLIKVLDVDRAGSEFDGQDPWIAALRLQWSLR